MSVDYNVFLSWSGSRSKAMAATLEPWLKRVIQSAKPYFSDKIEAGGFWDESIKASLKSVRFAIICCTPENIAAPWLNYEAGAMAERMEGGTVPWLLDAKPEALQSSPLSRLMARTADKNGTLSVVQTLNSALGSPVEGQVLSETFDDAWPKLEQKLKDIPPPETTVPVRSDRDMLEEVVGLCREIARETQQSRGEDAWLEARNLLEVQGPQGLAEKVPDLLSHRQREILSLLQRGHSYADIGAALNLSVNTVRSHLRIIYERLGAASKVEAIMIGMELGQLERSS